MSVALLNSSLPVLQWGRLSDRIGRKPVLVCPFWKQIRSSSTLMFVIFTAYRACWLQRFCLGLWHVANISCHGHH